MIGFADLQVRLVERIRAKLRNGEVTERGLARRIRVSQPHLHNVLKGVRALTVDLSDQLLREMRLSLSDLLEESGGAPVPQSRFATANRQREVPMLNGRVGPGHPWPAYPLWEECYLFPSTEVAGILMPAFGRLASDTRMAPVLRGCTLALLDLWNGADREIDSSGYYVVCNSTGCRIRKVKRGGKLLYLEAADNANRPESWEVVTVPDGRLATVIVAEVVWAGREPKPGEPLAHSGSFLGPITSR